MMCRTYTNILNKKQREKTLKFVKNSVTRLEGYPELQTQPNMHLKDEMKDFIKATVKYVKPYKISKCWALCSQGKFIGWHKHLNAKYSFVYYLVNPDKAGTMFLIDEKYGEIKYAKGEENSLIKFEGYRTHSPPNTHKKTKRYTIVFNVV